MKVIDQILNQLGNDANGEDEWLTPPLAYEYPGSLRARCGWEGLHEGRIGELRERFYHIIINVVKVDFVGSEHFIGATVSPAFLLASTVNIG